MKNKMKKDNKEHIKHVNLGIEFDYIYAKFKHNILYINDSYNKEKWGNIVCSKGEMLFALQP
jgi:hypothetical protein